MNKPTIVVGITSGIAAYKILCLITLLKKNANVLVVMTKSATQMISVQEVEKVSCNTVYIDLFDKSFDYKKVLASKKVDHIHVADDADLVVIAPATANTVAKLAHGIADDFLTTMVLATQARIMVFPSMNVHMWANPIVQENIQRLQLHGFIVCDPTEGDLACGYHGKGRLPEAEDIYKEVTNVLQKLKRLAGKKIIVTAGGTQEPIDGVRFIANKASGKMGVAIAEACFLQGADVLLVRSKTAVTTRYDISQREFETADELESILKKEVPKYNAIFHTAAISDFSVVGSKQKKLASSKKVSLVLFPRTKIILLMKKWNPRIKLIGFKAVWNSSENAQIKEAEKKLTESGADVIVVNDVSKSDRGFGSEQNEVIVVKKDSKKKISLRSKQEIAEELVKELL